MVSTWVDIFSVAKPAKQKDYGWVSSLRIYNISGTHYTVSSKTGAKFNWSTSLMLPPFFRKPKLLLMLPLQACQHHCHQKHWLRTSPYSFHHHYHHVFVLSQSLRISATLNDDYTDPRLMMLSLRSDVSAALPKGSGSSSGLMFLELEIDQTCAWSAYTNVSMTKQIELPKSTILLGVRCPLSILAAHGCHSCTNSSPRMLVALVGTLMKQKPQTVVISHRGSGWHNAQRPSAAQSWKSAKMSLTRACVWSGRRQGLEWWGGRKSWCSFKKRCVMSSLITSGGLNGGVSMP